MSGVWDEDDREVGGVDWGLYGVSGSGDGVKAVEEYRSILSTSVEALTTALLPWIADIANRVNRVLPKDGTEAMLKPLVLQSVAVADLLTASLWTGGIIFVSDETGGAQPAFSDGTDWRRFTDRAVVS